MPIDKTKISYRRAAPKDAAQLAEYRMNFIHEVFGISFNPKKEILYKELFIYFKESLADDSFIAWLAEYEGEIVSTSGLVSWQIPPSYSSLRSKGKRGYIMNMFTLKDFRKLGIASTLLKKLREEGKALGLEFLHLHSTTDGMGVYEAAGFTKPSYPELMLGLD